MNNQLLDSLGNPMKKMNYYTVHGFVNCRYLGTKRNNNSLMRFKMPNNNIIYRFYNSIPPPIPNENNDYSYSDIEDDSDNDFPNHDFNNNHFHGGKGKRIKRSIKRNKKLIRQRKSIRKK